MKIAFRKISAQSIPFEIKKDGMICSGRFKRNRDLIDISAKLSGEMALICDRCGEEFVDEIEEELDLKVNDGYYEGDDLDIIESHSGFVDFDEIVLGEIEAIKSEYHYCDKCKIKEGEDRDGST